MQYLFLCEENKPKNYGQILMKTWENKDTIGQRSADDQKGQ